MNKARVIALVEHCLHVLRAERIPDDVMRQIEAAGWRREPIETLYADCLRDAARG